MTISFSLLNDQAFEEWKWDAQQSPGTYHAWRQVIDKVKLIIENDPGFEDWRKKLSIVNYQSQFVTSIFKPIEFDGFKTDKTAWI